MVEVEAAGWPQYIGVLNERKGYSTTHPLPLYAAALDGRGLSNICWQYMLTLSTRQASAHDNRKRGRGVSHAIIKRGGDVIRT